MTRYLKSSSAHLPMWSFLSLPAKCKDWEEEIWLNRGMKQPSAPGMKQQLCSCLGPPMAGVTLLVLPNGHSLPAPPATLSLPSAPGSSPMLLHAVVLWCRLHPRLFGALRESGRPQKTPRRPVSRWAQQLESNPRQPAGGWSSRGATPDGQQVERAAGGQHHFVLNLTLITLVGILCGS